MDVILDLVPENCAVGMGVGNEIACTAIEICKKVAKDVDGGLALGQGAEAHTVHVEAHGAGAKTKFEAGTWVSVSVPLRRENVHTVPP